MAFIILVAVPLTIASGREPATISNGKENDSHGDEDSDTEDRHLHSSPGCAGTGTLPVSLLVSLKSDNSLFGS